MQKRLAEAWKSAEEEIVQLPGRNQVSKFRRSFQARLLESLSPTGVLDEFQIAGIFVNWWETVRYDLKTIVATGWSESILSDEYLLDAFFQDELMRINELGSRVNELDAELTQCIEETELETEASEDGEEKTLTSAQALKALKEEIAAITELEPADADQLRSLAETIAQKDKDLRTAKSELTKATTALYGKTDKDGGIKTPGLIHEKREALTEDEARLLILKKLYDLIATELERYLKSEQRLLVDIFENVFDKYAMSLTEIQSQREAAIVGLDKFLGELKYKSQ
jgi:type I restriction enzyme M protein